MHLTRTAALAAVSALCAASLRAAPAPSATVAVSTSAPALVSASKPLPVYCAELSNLDDYRLFANSGWDGNWYAGFNVCWMEELPAPPTGTYTRAFVGAKLGRMKTRPVAGKPSWEREAIPGSIYISLASTSAWKQNQGRFLADTQDIPWEGDAENALDGVGEARWFWAEVPITAVNLNGPNYAALWSPTEYLVSTASSPILAAGWGSQKVNSWMNNDVRGYPPMKDALKTPINVFEPAIAMKFIPAGSEQDITVAVSSVADGRANTANKTFTCSVSGINIERTWLELSPDNGASWTKHGRAAYTAPYQFTLKADSLPSGKFKVRAVAEDVWGNRGSSSPLEIIVSR